MSSARIEQGRRPIQPAKRRCLPQIRDCQALQAAHKDIHWARVHSRCLRLCIPAKTTVCANAGGIIFGPLLGLERIACRTEQKPPWELHSSQHYWLKCWFMVRRLISARTALTADQRLRTLANVIARGSLKLAGRQRSSFWVVAEPMQSPDREARCFFGWRARKKRAWWLWRHSA